MMSKEVEAQKIADLFFHTLKIEQEAREMVDQLIVSAEAFLDQNAVNDEGVLVALRKAQSSLKTATAATEISKRIARDMAVTNGSPFECLAHAIKLQEAA